MTHVEQSNCLLALLRSAWHLPTGYDFKPLAASEWQQLFRTACDNNVRAIVADGVRNAGLEVPRNVWLPWLAEVAAVEERYAEQREAMATLSAFFSAHGLPVLELKGGTLAALYPEPKHRESTDLDIYIFGQHRQADALLRAEFGIDIMDDGYHHTKFAFCGVTVENHYAFLNTTVRNRGYEQRLQQHVPSATFNALFLLRHMADHFASSRIGLRHLLDWMAFAEQARAEVDWDEVASAVAPMAQFVGAVQTLVHRWLQQEPIGQLPYSHDEELLVRVANDIVYGEFAQRHHDNEDLSRLVWKWHRYHANSWKRHLVGNTAADTLGAVLFHLRHPHTILHKS